jgi:hypothetical protein
MIEWRYFQDQWQTILSRRAEDLARTLGHSPKPEEFRTLHCIGFVEQTARSRLGFVYSIPQMPELPEKVYTLRGLYQKGTVPYLGDRFRLAQHILSSMMHFHTAGWLHREFRSDNIIFFSEDNIQRLCNPYVVGFERARPDHRAEVTLPDNNGDEEWAYYRHPARRNIPPPRFEREHDLYSIGLVLLEIGHWKPLATMTARRSTETNTEVGYLTQDNLKKWVRLLGSRMGEIYMQVVKECLDCVDEPNSDVNVEPATRESVARTSFYVNTVWALNKCTA